MSNPKKTQEVFESLPWLPVRWFILFRLYPNILLNPRYLFGFLDWRKPIYWNSVMAAEKNRKLRKKARKLRTREKI